jgi:hypothetical protein
MNINTINDEYSALSSKIKQEDLRSPKFNMGVPDITDFRRTGMGSTMTKLSTRY